MKCDNCGFNLIGNETNCPNCGHLINHNMNNQFTANQTYNGQQINNTKNSVNDNKQKIIIVSMLSIILLLLGIMALLLLSNSDDTVKRLQDGSRTIMIYLDGSNLESENKIATIDLESLDTEKIDLEKMNILIYTGGTEKWHNFVSNEENAIYILREDGFEKLEVYDKKNMGDASTFQEFLDYGYENYETQYYDLILYNHGGAIDGAIYDDFTKDHLSLEDFDTALDASPFNEKNKIDTVLFMTCLNGTVEVANVLSPYAKYLISSEEITNGGEIPQLDFFNEITVEDNEISYGEKFIEHYEEVMKEMDPLGFGSMPMYSIVDLSKVGNVLDLFNEFIESIDIEENYSDIVKIRSKMYQYAYTLANISQYDTVDLYTLIEKLDEFAKEDGEKVLDALDEAIVHNWSKHEDSHGLSVYFPYKANSSTKKQFLKIYEKIDNVESYYNFISKFNSLSTSNSASSFARFNKTENEAKIVEKEFTLQLSEEQKNDYAESIYMIFRKDKNGLYNPIYSSDNTQIGEDGLLRTNLSNNLIKLRDVTDPGFERYLTVVERTSTNKKTYLTNAVLMKKPTGNDLNIDSVGATVYFDMSGDVPKISNYFNIDSVNGTAGQMIDPNDYDEIDFVSSSYNILDNNGNYMEEWDNNGEITVYKLDIPNIELKKASLDDKEKYYCVFKILDIYGNTYYSELLSIN